MSVCWLCDRLIEDPPEIIGQVIAGQSRVAHVECLCFIGEIELGLRVEPPAGTDSTIGPGRP